MRATILLTVLAAANAFAPTTRVPTTSRLFSEVETPEVAEGVGPVADEPITPPKPALPTSSQALPFMDRPLALDGTLAGDVGFDPLGFAKDKETLFKMREAEVKHARLAMLAAAGWPISELLDSGLAKLFNSPALVDANDRVPSILNGGLGKVSPLYWGIVIGLSAAIDLYGVSRQGTADYIPGDLGFDPLGLYPKSPEERKDMQLREIKNGRLAMIAIVGFAIQEAVKGVGVVDETPFFFKPITATLGPYFDSLTNSGYIQW
eukprot:CAMPEP_0118654654 /NCGR_PEP_ID=MMETSP0785-20121206/12508_1 /TAXON_ID=91992 /ORGANISM="Bolidomonas pacifica, Strain CCMP 1866" /LENGTH=262 /DNA_ID=CAMNT_0006547335 /DNA_START=32 /DNA_END=818 /DNA_ORIENTATION=-